MGMIRIQVVGSFRPLQDKSFSAMHGGHAEAVAEAIEWLSREILPKAIEQDHQLHEEGAKPEKGFGARKEQ